MRRFLFLVLFLVVLSSLVCSGQTYFTLLGSDGNFYGSSGSSFYSVSPTTGATTTLNSAASSLALCLERSDGTFLGINYVTTDYWQLVKVSLSGQITPIAEFPTTISAPICPAIASDGNYYGSSVNGGDYGEGFLYQLTAAGALNVFYNFTGRVDGYGPSTPPVEGSDGNLYFFAGLSMLRYSPTIGLAVIPLPYNLIGPPQEGPNGDFYALDISASVVQVTTTGATSILYTAPDSPSGESPGLSNLTVLDNELAVLQGYTYGNYDGYDDCYAYGNYFSMLSLNPTSGTSGTIFSLGSDESYYGNYDEANADDYEYRFLLGGNGTFLGLYSDYSQQDYGEENCDEQTETLGPYSINAASTYPTIQMSLSKNHVLKGGTATLTWDVENAYSDTMQQCFGFGGLSGKVALSGTTTLTAANTGANVTSIVCGGTETGVATLNAGAATLSLVASSYEVLIGGKVTLTATVTNPGTPAPTGTVKFLYGATVVGSASLVSGAATFVASTTGLPAGTYNITASYSGDGNYGAANSPSIAITLVPRYPTYVTLSPPSQSLMQGATANITATVTGSSPLGYPTGSVTFLYGTTVLATTALTPESSTQAYATLGENTTGIPGGTYTITANYPGDTYNLPASSTSSVTVTVTPTTAVTLTASPNPVPATSGFTLTATPQGKITPTGTVIFYVNATQDLASTNLGTNGVATVMLPEGTLAAGSYLITAYYAGDKNNPSGTSPAVTLVVQ